jgi:hypothetical protein
MTRCEKLDADVAQAATDSIVPAGFDTYRHYTLRFEKERWIEVILDSPTQLEDLASLWIERLDQEWLPWMDARDTDDLTGATSYIEHRHVDLREIEF